MTSCLLFFLVALAPTPPMGWNSWEKFRLNIDEKLIRSIADAMVSTGMRDAGYQYVVVDAGWKAPKRDSGGRLVPNPTRFPSGMKALADYVHSKGLKFGIYTDAGRQDCVSNNPGSYGHEEIDAKTFAEWGVDYVKEDWCNTQGIDARTVYGKMSRALRATGRPIVLSLCEWGDNQPWLWAPNIAQLWRTTGDDMPCWDCGRDKMNWNGGYPRGWTLILDAQPPLAKYAGPGHWNDPDMLEVGQKGMTESEARAQFSLWSILAAPLMATNDVRTPDPILLNKEVIAVDQDAKGVEGARISSNQGREVWARPLQDGSEAVVLFNRTRAPAQITVNWKDIGLRATDLPVRDLWTHRDLARHNNFSATVQPHGIVMIRVSAR